MHPNGHPEPDDWQTIGAPVLAELPHDPLAAQNPVGPVRFHYRRPLFKPTLLFLATCASTYWVGQELAPGRIGPFSVGGLSYMILVMGILLAHELGHFVQAVRYHVPASLPFFIPMPFTPIGTMGAVILMPSLRDKIARLIDFNRLKIFDIALTGPLVGLAVAIPVSCIGVLLADAVPVRPRGGFAFGAPWAFQIIVAWLRPDVVPGTTLRMNPALMAGWVGLFVTGLNMLPVSQLDGGHVAYALLGRRAHLLARAVILAALAFIIVAGQWGWLVMVLLVLMIGVDHPPTVDDRAPLGPWRIALGWTSLLIPIFCLTPIPIAVG